WVATWTSAQQVPRPGFARRPTAPAAATGAPGATAPTPAPATPPAPTAAPAGPGGAPPAFVTRPARGFTNQTVRMVFHASLGGSQVRVHLSNAYGASPLVVGTAHIALHGTDS